MLDTSRRTTFTTEHEMFREQVRRFFERELIPHLDRWENQGIIDRDFWTKSGKAGLLCPNVPEAYGGLGLDFGFNAVIDEELGYVGSSAGISLHSDIVAPYILAYGSEAQKRHWLPRMISGETPTAIAMTEPGAGSDLQAIRTVAVKDGDDYLINGSKTYITNGQHADLVILAAKTDPAEGAKGISLILVESDRPGFGRGRNLDKIGLHGQDTSELFFHDLRVPQSNRLGAEGMGFAYLMNQLPQERLAIAIGAQAVAQRAFDEAIRFTRERKAFGRAIFEFQNTRFTLADLAARLQVGWAHLDWALGRHMAGVLTAAEASAAKLWHTELQWDLCDAALQLHGGAGYMNEYPIARLWRDARVTRIFGGTSEIMKEVIARAI
ncbi:acyl-CoA dehydrogenase family protein [Sphingosinicella sp. CPCC 101087]|uniref:acyl-CoA dehydrogenase family protein n=1 Tax=Sphingosinicella sp. CPCC 101087 TaxID=2497754 RepID=UPI00101BB457|nr:acyl-CoA dehydrogenase family protein [Sphingosinicella sp. CPCC 101087]